MESKNLDKALLIYSKLISGDEVSKRDSENGQLYEEYYSNAEVLYLRSLICAFTSITTACM